MTTTEKALAWGAGILAAIGLGWWVIKSSSKLPSTGSPSTSSCPNNILLTAENTSSSIIQQMQSYAQQIVTRQSTAGGLPLSTFGSLPSGCPVSVIIVQLPASWGGIQHIWIVIGDPATVVAQKAVPGSTLVRVVSTYTMS